MQADFCWATCECLRCTAGRPLLAAQRLAADSSIYILCICATFLLGQQPALIGGKLNICRFAVETDCDQGSEAWLCCTHGEGDVILVRLPLLPPCLPCCPTAAVWSPLAPAKCNRALAHPQCCPENCCPHKQAGSRAVIGWWRQAAAGSANPRPAYRMLRGLGWLPCTGNEV